MLVQFFDWHRAAKNYLVNLGDNFLYKIRLYNTGINFFINLLRMRLYIETHFVFTRKKIVSVNFAQIYANPKNMPQCSSIVAESICDSRILSEIRGYYNGNRFTSLQLVE